MFQPKLMAGQRILVTGGSAGRGIMTDGAHALTSGGSFDELRQRSDVHWNAMRERIETQNQKDKAQR